MCVFDREQGRARDGERARETEEEEEEEREEEGGRGGGGDTRKDARLAIQSPNLQHIQRVFILSLADVSRVRVRDPRARAHGNDPRWIFPRVKTPTRQTERA